MARRKSSAKPATVAGKPAGESAVNSVDSPARKPDPLGYIVFINERGNRQRMGVTEYRRKGLG